MSLTKNSLVLAPRVFLQVLQFFLSPQKTNISKFQFDLEFVKCI